MSTVAPGTRVTVVVELDRFAAILDGLAAQLGDWATPTLRGQIRAMVDGALGEAGLDPSAVPVDPTGDGAIVHLETAERAARFAEALLTRADAENLVRPGPSARRDFRVAAWSGPNGPRPSSDLAWSTGLLDGACSTGEVLVCPDTWGDLPRDLRGWFGPQESVRGRGAGAFLAHRRRVVDPAPFAPLDDLKPKPAPDDDLAGPAAIPTSRRGRPWPLVAVPIAAVLVLVGVAVSTVARPRLQPGPAPDTPVRDVATSPATPAPPPAPDPVPSPAPAPAPPTAAAPPAATIETEGDENVVISAGGNVEVNQAADPEVAEKVGEANEKLGTLNDRVAQGNAAEAEARRLEQERAAQQRAEDEYRRAVHEAEDGLDSLTGGNPQVRDSLRDAIAIFEPKGLNPPFVARSYNALGIIAFKAGDRDEARRNWTAARKIYGELGNKAMVRRMDERLQTLDPPAKR